jgi:hypothetical protein
VVRVETRLLTSNASTPEMLTETNATQGAVKLIVPYSGRLANPVIDGALARGSGRGMKYFLDEFGWQCQI